MSNWQKIGLKSKEDVFPHVLKCLNEDIEKLITRGLSNEVVFTWFGQTITLRGKAKKKNDKNKN